MVAAQVGRAPGVVALGGVSVVYGGVLVRALVVRAEDLAALLFLALVTFALDIPRVFDQRVAVRAFDGVAVVRVLLLTGGNKVGGIESRRCGYLSALYDMRTSPFSIK